MHLTDPINSQFLISLGLPNMLIFLIDWRFGWVWGNRWDGNHVD
jgi:hypothetical protein